MSPFGYKKRSTKQQQPTLDRAQEVSSDRGSSGCEVDNPHQKGSPRQDEGQDGVTKTTAATVVSIEPSASSSSSRGKENIPPDGSVVSGSPGQQHGDLGQMGSPEPSQTSKELNGDTGMTKSELFYLGKWKLFKTGLIFQTWRCCKMTAFAESQMKASQ